MTFCFCCMEASWPWKHCPARWLQDTEEGVSQGGKQSPSCTSTNAEYCERLIVLNGASGWDSVSMAPEEVTHGTTINTNLPAKSTLE